MKSVFSSATLFFMGVFILAFNAAKASEQTIATITTDSSERTYKLVIDSNDGREIKSFYRDVYEGGSKIRRDVLDTNTLSTGVILEQRDKYIVLRLKSNNFDLEQGGIVTVDTLYNGATGERRGYDLQIATGKNGWAIFKQKKAISRLDIKTHRIMIIGEVGIKNIEMK